MDAIKFVGGSPSPQIENVTYGEEFVIDNVDAEASMPNGFWDKASGSGYIETNFSTVNNGNSKATYTPDLSGRQGNYELFVRYTDSWWDLGTDCPYVIYHDGGITEVLVDQTVNGGTWVSIGAYSLSQGAKVEIGAWLSNNKKPCMDAIKFVGGSPSP